PNRGVGVLASSFLAAPLPAFLSARAAPHPRCEDLLLHRRRHFAKVSQAVGGARPHQGRAVWWRGRGGGGGNDHGEMRRLGDLMGGNPPPLAPRCAAPTHSASSSSSASSMRDAAEDDSDSPPSQMSEDDPGGGGDRWEPDLRGGNGGGGRYAPPSLRRRGKPRLHTQGLRFLPDAVGDHVSKVNALPVFVGGVGVYAGATEIRMVVAAEQLRRQRSGNLELEAKVRISSRSGLPTILNSIVNTVKLVLPKFGVAVVHSA
ncbi:unnamed protein product, partial [Urochloa humidicola]